ncbi:hypothetical protein ACLB2K_040516 [Fragaria x ananassa]
MEKPRAKCNYCPQTYLVHSKSIGTSSMRHHMLTVCKKCPLYSVNKRQRYLTFDFAEGGGNLKSYSYDPDVAKLACARMIIRDELPFSFVEKPGFIEKVFTIVVDNASPNQVALDYMRDKIGNWKELILNGAFLHMRWCCHILNLIVKDGIEELGSSIDAIRNCVKYNRSSPARLMARRLILIARLVLDGYDRLSFAICDPYSLDGTADLMTRPRQSHFEDVA